HKLEEYSFWLYKTHDIMNEYIDIFRAHADLSVKNLLELGIWESGSVAFWTQFFRPDMHVAIDLAPPREPASFRQFLRDEGLSEKLKTYWQTDQSDEPRLRSIIRRHFLGPLDLVI